MYEVPEGQDPAVVVSALATAGFETSFEEVAARRIVSIEPNGGATPDREEIRRIIAATPSMIDAGVPLSTAVIFEDERSP